MDNEFARFIMPGAFEEETKEEEATTEKHLAGMHNQKRHGWRYGGGVDSARRSMRGLKDPKERAEYRKRAGMGEAKKVERKQDADGTVYAVRSDDKGKFRFVPISGAKKVAIDGYKEHEFFSYKDPKGNSWYVIEGKTGMGVHSSSKVHKTRKAAIQSAREQMARLSSKNSFAEAMNYALKRYGLSPRYQS